MERGTCRALWVSLHDCGHLCTPGYALPKICCGLRSCTGMSTGSKVVHLHNHKEQVLCVTQAPENRDTHDISAQRQSTSLRGLHAATDLPVAPSVAPRAHTKKRVQGSRPGYRHVCHGRRWCTAAWRRKTCTLY